MSKPWIKKTEGCTLRYNENTDCLEFVKGSGNFVVAYLPMDDVYTLNATFRVGGDFIRKFNVIRFFEYSESIKDVVVTWLPDQYKLEVSSASDTVKLDGNFPKHIKDLCKWRSGQLDVSIRSVLSVLSMSEVQKCKTTDELIELVERYL